MKCPKCNLEMEVGMIQSGKIIIWTDKKHRISLQSRKEDIVLADNPLGGATVTACVCRNCELVLVEYGEHK